MAKYNYNGEILPALPEYDTEAYPYAFITTEYTLFLLDKPVYYLSAPDHVTVEDGETATGTKYYNEYNGEWGSAETVQITYKDGMGTVIKPPIWANFDVEYAATGEVYLSRSEPVLVDDEETEDDDTTGGDPDGTDPEAPVYDKYLYNGVELPALPDYDKELYPYAVITDDHTLHVHEFPIVINYNEEYNTNPFITCQAGVSDGYSYAINQAGDAWEDPQTRTFGTTDDGIFCVSSVFPIWSNHDVLNIFNGQNTLYLKGSVPVPVEGDDDTGNEDTDQTPDPTPDPEPEPEIPLDKTPILAELYITKGRKLYQIGGASSYTPISITSFKNDAGTKEYGEVVTGLLLSWSLNKKAKTLTLDGEALDVSINNKILSGLSITHDANKTWTLAATDERGASASKNTTITFANGVYYGAASEPAQYNSAFIRGLTKKLQNSKVSPFTANAGAGQYIYYALPKRLGTCVFTVGVLPGGFELAATIAFENAHGYTEDYYIYKSVNANLGDTTVSVS